jgi:hypothetical protein
METSATTLHKKRAIFTVRQLSRALGAEIVGVDLRDPSPVWSPIKVLV